MAVVRSAKALALCGLAWLTAARTDDACHLERSAAPTSDEVGLTQTLKPAAPHKFGRVMRPGAPGQRGSHHGPFGHYLPWAPLRLGLPAECNVTMEILPYKEAKLWGTAFYGWYMCAGRSQSPINLHLPGKKRDTAALNQSYGQSGPDTRLVNTGHDLKVEGQWGPLNIDGKSYQSSSFHFHTPSEHTVMGKRFDAEMHIVNVANDSSVAVVDILINIGAENPCLAKVLSDPAPLAGCGWLIGSLDLSCFREQFTGSFWRYSGSLTTPPCTEGVIHNVMKTVATISKEQYQVLKSRYTMNARPVQRLNGRQVMFNAGKK